MDKGLNYRPEMASGGKHPEDRPGFREMYGSAASAKMAMVSIKMARMNNIAFAIEHGLPLSVAYVDDTVTTNPTQEEKRERGKQIISKLIELAVVEQKNNIPEEARKITSANLAKFLNIDQDGETFVEELETVLADVFGGGQQPTTSPRK